VAKRLDLQGLRALAVLLVVLNHAHVSAVSGGYVGVDVFFVLSGYLITGILVRGGLGRNGGPPGRISINDFYDRRVRRIVPAASLTLVVICAAVFVIYDVDRADFLQTKSVLIDALAAAFFVANVRFAHTSTNYFTQASTTMPSPVQHFWSLSVEEQFYLVWAPVLACMFYVCRKLTGRRSNASDREEKLRRGATRMIGAAVVTVCVLSLAWSIHDTAANPRAAYFSTTGRAWELGLGAAIAVLGARAHGLPAILRALLGWLGFAMIIAAAVLYSSRTPFPGYAALLPVIGSCLIIVAGMTPTRAGADRMLSARPLAYIGDRSYTFYLWHYPALILIWQAAGRVLPVTTNLLILAGALMLSVFTYKFYENPLRFARWLRGRRTFALIPIALGTCAFAVVLPIALFESTLAAQASVSATTHVVTLAPAPGQADPTSLVGSTPIPAVAAAAKSAQRGAPLPKAILPSLTRLGQEGHGSDVSPDCVPTYPSGVTPKRLCRLGDGSSTRVVAVIGDSHAGSWIPALRAVGRSLHFAVVPLNKSGCLLGRIDTDPPGRPCASWYRWAVAKDKALHPVATIVSFMLTQFANRQTVAINRIRSVLSQVTNGVLIADQPAQAQLPGVCIPTTGATMRECSTRVPSSYLGFMRALARMTHMAGHPVIPTMQWFCANGICPMVINNTITTRDTTHLTTEYSTELAPLLGLELSPILARLGHSPALRDARSRTATRGAAGCH
jgi:peptidoglycan/LPS O-acetylase OafA/YrhL